MRGPKQDLFCAQMCALRLELVVRQRAECIPMPRRIRAAAKKKKPRDPELSGNGSLKAAWFFMPLWAKFALGWLLYKELERGRKA